MCFTLFPLHFRVVLLRGALFQSGKNLSKRAPKQHSAATHYNYMKLYTLDISDKNAKKHAQYYKNIVINTGKRVVAPSFLKSLVYIR